MGRTSTRAWRTVRDQARAQAIHRGQWACPICQTPLDYEWSGRPNSAEVDHINPHANGGPDHIDNTRVICRTCNRRLGGKLGNQRSRHREPPKPLTPDTTAAW